MKEIKIFFGKSHPILARKIGQQVGVSLSPLKIKEYANGCFEIILQDNVKDCKVFLIQTSIPRTLHRDLWELLQMVNAAKKNGAREIIVVMPYISYARSDKKYTQGMTISGELLIKLLRKSGMTGFIGIDFHSKRLKKFFTNKTKVYHLSVLSLIVRYLKNKNLKNTIVLPADKGASKSANFLAKELNIPVGSVNKIRISDTKAIIEKITGEVAGKDVIFFDDEISPAATTCNNFRKRAGKKKSEEFDGGSYPCFNYS